MITFWVPAGGCFGIQLYLEQRGADLVDRIVIRHLEDLAPDVQTIRGTHIFAGLETLTPAESEAVASLRDQIAAAQPGLPLLNDPRRVLHRYDLLRRLADEGINQFQVFRASDLSAVDRFPVFVRYEKRHTGSLTQLLHSRSELDRALARLRLRGHRLRDLLIVEYCHTADADGYFRKYAAYCLGDRIVPAHLMTGRSWMLKASGDLPDVPRALEGLAFARDNPHAEWLHRVFDIAGAQYGRIDYGVLDGVPQVWEINLNPTMTRMPHEKRKDLPPEVRAIRDEARTINHTRIRDAWRALDPDVPPDPITVSIHPQVLARIQTDRAKARRWATFRGLLGRLYEHPQVGAPFRFLYSRAFQRM